MSYARMLCENISVSRVFIEEKPISSTSLRLKEEIYFADSVGWLPESYRRCKKGEINSLHIENEIREEEPDIMFVFGSSLLKENIFSIPKDGCVNIHTGLVQYYRGVDSAFWALYDERPDRIGSTIHFIDKTIDAGSIIAQARLNSIKKEDDLDDIFLKNCICGFHLLQSKIPDLTDGDVKTIKLASRGKLYQIKDKTSNKIHEIEEKLGRILGNYCD
jgi:methionyl-tRNA formyltransferase